ncbi:MAG: GNAT family N-acetyltransferase [Burkholderiaceae bacterium]
MASSSFSTVRPARPDDARELLSMMKALADFEGYLEQFRVTVDALLERGLDGQAEPQFFAAVAEVDDVLCGYAVCVDTHFTVDLCPTAVLKELYVEPAYRGLGIAQALFDFVRQEASARGAARLQWLVLPWNVRAQRFYRRQGGREDLSWQRWAVDLKSL